MSQCYVLFDHNSANPNNRVICVTTTLAAMKKYAVVFFKTEYGMRNKKAESWATELIESGVDDLEVYEGESLTPISVNKPVAVGYIEAYNPIAAVGTDANAVLKETAEALLEEFGDYGFTEPVEQLMKDIAANVTDGYIQYDIPVVG